MRVQSCDMCTTIPTPHHNKIMDSEAILKNFFDRSKIEGFSVADNLKKDQVVDVSESILNELLQAVRLQHSHQFELVMNNIENGFEIDKSLLPEMKELRIYTTQSYSLSHLVESLRAIESECEAHDGIISEKILLRMESLKSKTIELQKALKDIIISKEAISTKPKFSKCSSLLESD